MQSAATRSTEDPSSAMEIEDVAQSLTTERLNDFTSRSASLKYGDSFDTASSTVPSATDSDTSSNTGTIESVEDLENPEDKKPYEPPTGSETLIHAYFRIWNIATCFLLLINFANMNWKFLFENASWWMIMLSVTFFIIQGVLQWSVLELPLMSFASLYVKPEQDKVADGSHLSVIINYNLLASYHCEVDSTLMNAFMAYTGNLSPSVVMVLVSATGDEGLKAYELEVRDNFREQISHMILTEGLAWATGNKDGYDAGRAIRVFDLFRDKLSGGPIDGFLESILPALAKKYADGFMVVHRVTRVLRKCGQYQDLMLLSEGDNNAWTYTDPGHYNEAARKYNENLFHPSDDVENIQGKCFDYILVLDGDTGVVKDSVSRLMSVAAANPGRAILQPSIEMTATEDQSLFMHIDKLRQEIHAPITAAVTTLMGRSGFYGKGLIQTRLYIRAVLGTRFNPVEKVPIDVLSHDTFEAAALSPLFVNSVSLLEEPCGNYVTWDIRETRWNRGELILSHYFFPRTFGRFFSSAMKVARQDPPTKLKLRYETHLDAAGAYIAHSALRQMCLKPTLLLFIITRVWVKVYFYYNWIPLALMVLVVMILPKIPLTRRDNWWKVFLELFASVIQYSGEPIVGTYRVYRAVRAHICGSNGWVPQFKVEQDFAKMHAIIAAFSYQWINFLVMCCCLVPIYHFRPDDFLLQFLFAVTAFLPFYTTLTAIPYSSWVQFIERLRFFVSCKCMRPIRCRRQGSLPTSRPTTSSWHTHGKQH